ncbi:hypothetical protein [Streptomyces sp. SCL15-4]|uniref:hypothetical protein n=1 Tax=Streptomyces sp. SCL15-4 TaxID=2967221 RepID=UPI002966E0B8|nr:hypothetical protein [Streptomyces sp. SCL15-4]
MGFGRAAERLSRERVASKQTVAAVREPLTRAATAVAPLMRCCDPAVATWQLLNALFDVEDTARLEAALEAFGRAVNAATAPRPDGHVAAPHAAVCCLTMPRRPGHPGRIRRYPYALDRSS